MSPLNLSTNAPARPLSPSVDPLSLGPAAVDASAAAATPVIGLVDELDDPGPGHLSDHPTALTSTTTTVPTSTDTPANAPSGAQASATTVPKPMFGGSLQERFVKSTESEITAEADMESAPSATGAAESPSGARDAPSSGAEAVSNVGVGNGNNNNMVVDESEADKENVPKSS